jgi:hypothetical protein
MNNGSRKNPPAVGRQNLRRKRELAMHFSTTANDQGRKSVTTAPWEKRMDMAMQGILEILEENVKWWEQAAVTCEHTAARMPAGEKEGWQLMGAVYRERAEKHSRLIEQFRRENNSAHP